ncbi:MAG: hypothetical protein KUG64_10290 [Cycloclasticus sp.]|nr:hypothetical protein [Cycloclasticus sp.]
MDIYETSGYIVHPRFPENRIHETAIIGSNVEIGKGNTILPYAVIGQAGFIRKGEKPKGKVIIGDNNTIGCYVNIMIGSEGKTFIGDNNLIMNHSNIGHDVMIQNDNEIGAGSIVNGYARIKCSVKIKSGCIIRNRIAIESEVTIGQGSNVVKDILKAGTYFGNPAELKKYKYPLQIKP